MTCGQISLYWLEVAEDKRKHSTASYADFYVKSLRKGVAYSIAGVSVPGKRLVYCKGLSKCSTEVHFNPNNLNQKKYKKYILYGGEGNYYKSSMHFSAFFKKGDKYVLYNHNAGYGRPCTSGCDNSSNADAVYPTKNSNGLILSTGNLAKMWRYHSYAEDDYGEKITNPKSWIKVYGTNQ